MLLLELWMWRVLHIVSHNAKDEGLASLPSIPKN